MEKNKIKPTCFVCMPIREVEGYPKNHFTRVYELLFEKGIEDAGYIPKRVDRNKGSKNIWLEIVKELYEADMVLADISTLNENVMYELGIRHTYGKPSVIVKDRKTTVPFDIRYIRNIEYNEELPVDNVYMIREKIRDFILNDDNNRNDIINSTSDKILTWKSERDNWYNIFEMLDNINSKIDMIGVFDKKSQNIYNVKSITIGGKTISLDGKVYNNEKYIGIASYIDSYNQILTIEDDKGNINTFSFDYILKNNIGER